MIGFLFFLSSTVALISALLTVTRHNAVHALLYLVITMMAIAMIFFLLGAAFAAALQIIVYAGAIMVLFVFVTMMLHQGEVTMKQEALLYQAKQSSTAIILCVLLLLELVYMLSSFSTAQTIMTPINVNELGAQLYGPYLLLVELSALLLLSALVGAFHIGRRHQEQDRQL
ncbi:MAG: NADH-quinone oxidoreductase subunit J [Methylococcales bacterium]